MHDDGMPRDVRYHTTKMPLWILVQHGTAEEPLTPPRWVRHIRDYTNLDLVTAKAIFDDVKDSCFVEKLADREGRCAFTITEQGLALLMS